MSRPGLYAPRVEKRRTELGLDEKGFRLDGTDPAKGDKEAMEREMYRRADARLPEGLGAPADSGESED